MYICKLSIACSITDVMEQAIKPYLKKKVAVRCRNATRRCSSSVKTAAPLATCTKELRSVIRHLSSEGVKPIEIHRRMKVQ